MWQNENPMIKQKAIIILYNNNYYYDYNIECHAMLYISQLKIRV